MGCAKGCRHWCVLKAYCLRAEALLPWNTANNAKGVAHLCMHVRTHAYTDIATDTSLDTDIHFNARVFVSAHGGVDAAKLWKRKFHNKAGLARQQFVVVRSSVDLLVRPCDAGLQPEVRSFNRPFVSHR